MNLPNVLPVRIVFKMFNAKAKTFGAKKNVYVNYNFYIIFIIAYNLFFMIEITLYLMYAWKQKITLLFNRLIIYKFEIKNYNYLRQRESWR